MLGARVIVRLVVALSFAPGIASAEPNQLYLGDNVLAPIAHTIFCTNYPPECSNAKAATSFFTVDLKILYSQLDSVNREVNAAIQPAPESANKFRQWALFPPTGTCNDYVVSKRHELLRRGWP